MAKFQNLHGFIFKPSFKPMEIPMKLQHVLYFSWFNSLSTTIFMVTQIPWFLHLSSIKSQPWNIMKPAFFSLLYETTMKPPFLMVGLLPSPSKAPNRSALPLRCWASRARPPAAPSPAVPGPTNGPGKGRHRRGRLKPGRSRKKGRKKRHVRWFEWWFGIWMVIWDVNHWWYNHHGKSPWKIN